MKTLIVVSGGDASGINTVIARYTMQARRQGDEVIGVTGGFAGVLRSQFEPIDLSLVRLLEGSGGSYLTSSRDPVLSDTEAQVTLRAVLEDAQIDNMLLFGGDGTLRHVLPLLNQWQVPVIALPTTIDNDIAGTERTLGFDSACNFAYGVISGALATAHALPGRIFMVETLGGNTGYLALDIGFATGAHAVLLPEYTFEMSWLSRHLKQAITKDGFALVVLSEGVTDVMSDLSERIVELTDTRVRFTRLGHAQRGGTVSHGDRRLASEMAYLAYRALREGVSNGAIIVRNGTTQLYQRTFGADTKPSPDYDLYRLVNSV
ncbi:MAG: 6-phosphofructokinase [Chloroflexota bacterium]